MKLGQLSDDTRRTLSRRLRGKRALFILLALSAEHGVSDVDSLLANLTETIGEMNQLIRLVTADAGQPQRVVFEYISPEPVPSDAAELDAQLCLEVF